MKPLILIRPRILASQLGIARATLWRWVQQGILPRPIRIGGIAGWRPEDIEKAIEKAKRDRETQTKKCPGQGGVQKERKCHEV